MCDPITLTAITVGATLMTAYSQKQAGDSAAKSAMVTAENNNNVDKYNAQIQSQDAVYKDVAAVSAENVGAQAGAQQRLNARVANATGKANAAGGGLLVDQGTVGALEDQNVGAGELNALTAQNNAENTAYNYRVGATDSRAEAQNILLQGQAGLTDASYQSKVLKSNGNNAALSTLVTGAANAGGNYFSMTSGAGTSAPFQRLSSVPTKPAY